VVFLPKIERKSIPGGHHSGQTYMPIKKTKGIFDQLTNTVFFPSFLPFSKA